MKVFIDTNVWLSGRFWPGLCAELLEGLVENGQDLLLDERVLAEFTTVGSCTFLVFFMWPDSRGICRQWRKVWIDPRAAA